VLIHASARSRVSNVSLQHSFGEEPPDRRDRPAQERRGRDDRERRDPIAHLERVALQPLGHAASSIGVGRGAREVEQQLDR
jgi:hypothetical protein